MAFSKDGTIGEQYRAAIDLRTKDDLCALDKHFRGALRLVVHQLELLAQNNGMGFVYVRVPALTKLCRKFGKQGARERVSQRTIEYALTYLREQGIISPIFTLPSHLRLDGVRGRRGFLVIHHDTYAVRKGKRCGMYPWGKDAFRGGTHIPLARWLECHPDHPLSIWNERNRGNRSTKSKAEEFQAVAEQVRRSGR
jgi:hypothetical protein